MRRIFAVAMLGVLTACASPAGPVVETQGGRIVEGSLEAFAAELEAREGTPVVVNFWATWCTPCRVEMPRIVDAAQTYGDEVSFLGVNVEDDLGAAADFIEEHGIGFESVADPDGEIRREEKVLGLPVTQFYSAAGELAFMHHGEISEDELTEKIEETLRLSG